MSLRAARTSHCASRSRGTPSRSSPQVLPDARVRPASTFPITNPCVDGSRARSTTQSTTASVDLTTAGSSGAHKSVRARRLVQGATGRVLGIEVESANGTETIRARRAVVLACGGFESAPDTVIADLPTPSGFHCGDPEPDPHNSTGFGPNLLYLVVSALLARPLVRRRR